MFDIQLKFEDEHGVLTMLMSLRAARRMAAQQLEKDLQNPQLDAFVTKDSHEGLMKFIRGIEDQIRTQAPWAIAQLDQIDKYADHLRAGLVGEE